jgi:hypothetical protein
MNAQDQRGKVEERNWKYLSGRIKDVEQAFFSVDGNLLPIAAAYEFLWRAPRQTSSGSFGDNDNKLHKKSFHLQHVPVLECWVVVLHKAVRNELDCEARLAYTTDANEYNTIDARHADEGRRRRLERTTENVMAVTPDSGRAGDHEMQEITTPILLRTRPSGLNLSKSKIVQKL